MNERVNRSHRRRPAPYQPVPTRTAANSAAGCAGGGPGAGEGRRRPHSAAVSLPGLRDLEPDLLRWRQRQHVCAEGSSFGDRAASTSASVAVATYSFSPSSRWGGAPCARSRTRQMPAMRCLVMAGRLSSKALALGRWLGKSRSFRRVALSRGSSKAPSSHWWRAGSGGPSASASCARRSGLDRLPGPGRSARGAGGDSSTSLLPGPWGTEPRSFMGILSSSSNIWLTPPRAICGCEGLCLSTPVASSPLLRYSRKLSKVMLPMPLPTSSMIWATVWPSGSTSTSGPSPDSMTRSSFIEMVPSPSRSNMSKAWRKSRSERFPSALREPARNSV
mmetsp:Transcript_46567/g.148668  ORF Transcript_46567/g.148668 Transcript_46567/m.148668 type:complete len:333 (-) Transcript_46567:1774-2772(-)